jgi:hypothetical protein
MFKEMGLAKYTGWAVVCAFCLGYIIGAVML